MGVKETTQIGDLDSVRHPTDNQRCPLVSLAGERLQPLGHLSKLRTNHVRKISDVVVQSIQSGFNTNPKYDARDFAALSRRLGLNGESEPLASITKDCGLTRERIRQIQNRALRKCGSRGGGEKIQKQIERQLSLQVQSILKK
jgi:hypothetical protein